MKCIQSIKPTKNVAVGVIKRVNDKEADSEVKGGYWKYVPKTEWKQSGKKIKPVNEEVKENYPENIEDNKSNKKNNKKTKK